MREEIPLLRKVLKNSLDDLSADQVLFFYTSVDPTMLWENEFSLNTPFKEATEKFAYDVLSKDVVLSFNSSIDPTIMWKKQMHPYNPSYEMYSKFLFCWLIYRLRLLAHLEAIN